MDKLDYDLNHASGVFRDDSLIVDVTEQLPDVKSGQANAIEFSNKVVLGLQDKLKSHNQEHSKRLKLHQLKEAFCRGAKMFPENQKHKLVEWGLARVNLFLRVSSGKINNINLELPKNTPYNKLMDIADYFCPSTADFEQAEKDVGNYDLDQHFENIDELYIDEKPETSYFWRD